jgi:hypothetical protein
LALGQEVPLFLVKRETDHEPTGIAKKIRGQDFRILCRYIPALAWGDFRLMADLEKIEESEWIAHFNTAAYENEWCCAPLRSVDGRSDHIVSISDAFYQDTAILARCPYFREAVSPCSSDCQTLLVT